MKFNLKLILSGISFITLSTTQITAVASQDPPAATCTLKISASGVKYQGKVTISWTTKNASKVYIQREYPTDYVKISTIGSSETRPLLANTIFKLRAWNSKGQLTQCSAQVNVEPPANIVALAAGQSNMARYFSDAVDRKDPNYHGYQYFAERMPQIDTSVKSAEMILAASGGSSVLAENRSGKLDGQNYWLNYDKQTQQFSAGPLLESAIAKIKSYKNANNDINYIFWAQGEQDALKMETRAYANGSTDRERAEDLKKQVEIYEKSLYYLFKQLRDATGFAYTPVVVQELGQRNRSTLPGTSTAIHTHIAIHSIQQVQNRISKNLVNVFVMAHTYDASLADTVHMDKAGQILVLERLMKNIARQRRGLGMLTGPRIAKIKRLGTNALRVKVVSASSILKIGNDAAYLFSVNDQFGNLLMRATRIAQISDSMIELTFDQTVPNGSQLIAGFGVVGPEETAGYVFADHGRYVYDKYRFPIAPTYLQIPD